MKKFFEKVMAMLNSIGIDKYLHFVAGLIIAAFFAIALGMEACIAPAIVAGILKEVVDESNGRKADWADLVATIAGGAVIQLIVILF